MQDIKVYHKDGLIYFNRFRVAELMLLKKEGTNDKYLLIIDIQSYDYFHAEDEITKLEQQFATGINNNLNYVWVTLEEFCTLQSIDELNGLTISLDDSEDKFLYFGWHVPLFNNVLKFTKDASLYVLSWMAISEDVNYYDERAKNNKVEIHCKLTLFVFDNKEEYQKHEKLKNKQRETYFSILRSFSGQAIPEQDTYAISEILLKNLTEIEQNELAWKFAVDNTPK